jgi:branched-chain amino acid transport system substrate-binding protein
MSITAGASYSGEVEKIVASGADAVFFAGEGSEGAAALWQQLHTGDPRLTLLGPSALAEEQGFTAQLGAAAASTYLTTPALAPRLYPPSGRRVLAQYERQFGGEASAYALYGYEAMSLVLSAIRSAGSAGNNRQVVVQRLLATRNRDSVLGRYSVQADGETTFTSYGVDRVQNGRPVFFKALTAHP